MSNGKIEFKWRHDKCLSLIEAYDRRKSDFNNPLNKKKDLWGEVAKEINDEHNTDITWEMAYKKFRNLKSTYFHVKDKHSNSFYENKIIRWTYFELFQNIFPDKTGRYFVAISAPPVTPVRLTTAGPAVCQPQTAAATAPISNASSNTVSNERDDDDEDDEDDGSNETPSEEYASLPSSSHFRWTYDKNITLLETYNDRKEKIHDPKIKKKNVWEEIANVINKKHQTNLSGEVAHKKFRNLKSTYIKVKSKLIDSSTSKPIRWEYFDHFEEIFYNPIYMDDNDGDADADAGEANHFDPEDDCSIEVIETDEFIDDLQSNVPNDVDGQDGNGGLNCNDDNVATHIDLNEDRSNNGSYSENNSVNGNSRLSSSTAGSPECYQRGCYQREKLLIEREKLRKLHEIKETNNERNQILRELVEFLKTKV